MLRSEASDPGPPVKHTLEPFEDLQLLQVRIVMTRTDAPILADEQETAQTIYAEAERVREKPKWTEQSLEKFRSFRFAQSLMEQHTFDASLLWIA